MAKKFIIEKETEYKNGKVSNWYYIKLQTDNDTQVIDLIRDEKPEGDVHLQEERRLCYVAMTRAKNAAQQCF